MSQDAPSSAVSDASSASFEADAERVLARLRSAAERLLNSAPEPVARAVDLSRSLRVDAALGWQVFRLAKAEDPFATVPFVPSSVAMERVLRAAHEYGFSHEAVRYLQQAYTEFEHLVEVHAGDRSAFDAMAAGLGRETPEQTDLRDRRSYFQAGSRLWGVQAKLQYGALITVPSTTSGYIHLARVDACSRLQQLRTVSAIVTRSTPPAVRRISHEELVYNFDPSCTTETVIAPVLLEEFCSQPLPTLETMNGGDAVHDTLRLQTIGRSSSTDYVAYDLVYNVKSNPERHDYLKGMVANIPCEVLVTDYLLPHGLVDPTTVRVSTHGSLSDITEVMRNPMAHVMPTKETVEYLGTDLGDLRHPLMPKCHKAVEKVLRKLNWMQTEFDIFRCRVRYPILNTAIIMWLDRPKLSVG